MAKKAPKGSLLPKRKSMAIQVRASDEWTEWLDGLASRRGYSVTALVEELLRRYARDEGYPDPPRR